MILPDVTAYGKWNFRVVGVYRSFLRSAPLSRDNDGGLPLGAGCGNAACELLKPLYGISTDCKDCCATIRDYRAKGCGWGVSSMDRSVFPWTQQGFSYIYGNEYRAPCEQIWIMVYSRRMGISENSRKDLFYE